ncbi:MAG: ATP synthase subunit I [Gammaproteobacteria bacterium]
MSEVLTMLFALLPALLEGALLGVFFFAGLWWTVRKIESSKYVALLFLGSMLLRTSVVILGFYFILGDNWQRLLAGLLGFVIARIIVTRLTRIAEQSKNSITAGG